VSDLKPRVGAKRDPSSGRLAAPGQLLAGDVGITEPDADALALSEYALRHGLLPSAQRPPMLAYIRQLWVRRHFIIAFATARNIAMYTEAKLGQIWQVLTPLLNVGVYWLIFGVILDTSRGVDDYLSFLVVGVFVFNFTQRAFLSTSKVITESLPLIRALQFPRAALPLAYVIIELEQLLISMAVLVVIILFRGEPVTWYWLLVIPALILQSIFNIGAGLLVARVGSQLNDFSQLLPFLLRTWMYLSLVLFSISTLADPSNPMGFGTRHPWALTVLQLNPAALYITLMRYALLTTARESMPGAAPYNEALCREWPGTTNAQHLLSAHCAAVLSTSETWISAAGWSAFALVVGFVYFWWAETRYGRG
jgi:teichoic acid transport system permease protein